MCKEWIAHNQPKRMPTISAASEHNATWLAKVIQIKKSNKNS